MDVEVRALIFVLWWEREVGGISAESRALSSVRHLVVSPDVKLFLGEVGRASRQPREMWSEPT